MVRAQAVVAQRVGKKGWPCHLSHKGGEAGKSPSRQAPREGAAAQEPVETLDLEPAWWLGGLALQGLPLPESGSLHHSSYKAFHPRSQSAPRRDRAPQPPGAGGGGAGSGLGWAPGQVAPTFCPRAGEGVKTSARPPVSEQGLIKAHG